MVVVGGVAREEGAAAQFPHLDELWADPEVLRRVKGIAMCHLTSADVVRHPLVARIVDAYDQRGRTAAARKTAE